MQVDFSGLPTKVSIHTISVFQDYANMIAEERARYARNGNRRGRNGRRGPRPAQKPHYKDVRRGYQPRTFAFAEMMGWI